MPAMVSNAECISFAPADVLPVSNLLANPANQLATYTW
jgi:hypothetical protein